MKIFPTGVMFCSKCGKRFQQERPGQKFCYNPCVPLNQTADLYDMTLVKRDCVMFHDDKGEPYCSALNAVYCGFADCKFYKPRE